nr:AAA domain-containing protein [Acetanaerobacterium sp. MSJ-12]
MAVYLLFSVACFLTVHEHYIQEFIEVLKTEIEELKKSKDNNIILINGVLHESKNGHNIYRFDTEQPFFHQDNVVYKMVTGSAQFDCEYVSSDNCQIYLRTFRTLSLNQEITLFLDHTTLPEKLLQCFQESLQDANQRYAIAARLFNGRFQVNNNSIPNLRGYSQVNEYQKAAVVRSFQGDTIIWGPPGTGKTHTIAIAINEQIKRGRRVLLLSHANTAVDGAMEELADLLYDEPVYTKGHLVRIGVSQLDKYPMLSLDEIIRVKLEELSAQIKILETELLPIQAKFAGLLKIQSMRESYRQKQVDISKKKTTYHQQEKELKQLMAETEQDEKTLQSLKEEQSRLETKAFQTGHTKATVLLVSQEIDEVENACKKRQDAINLLQSKQSAFASEISNLVKIAHFEISTIQSALSVAGLTELSLEKGLKELSKKADEVEGQIRELMRQIAAMRRQVLEEAAVVGATLSMTYMSVDLRTQQFDTLVIDEISMAPLLPIFFAMGLVRSSCTLIGDFLQLPPIGTQSKNKLLRNWQNRNFFEMIGMNSVAKARSSEFVKPLSIQYRMNPAIASIPNRLFYGGILQSGDNTKTRVLFDRWVQDRPLFLVDTSEGDPWMNRGPNGQSRCNLYHATLVAAMAQDYLANEAQSGKEVTVGVVVPYRPQKDLINTILDESLGKNNPKRKRIEVNTVHSFQGGEKDIIICDSVESEGTDTKWFFFDDGSRENLSAQLMLNVAITRAKFKFVLLANVKFVQQNFKGHIFKDLLDILHQYGATLAVSELGIGFQTTEEENEIKQLSERVSAEELGQYNQNSFWAKVIPDLKNASRRVIIFCPFVREGRIEILLPIFEEIIEAGGEVIVYTRSVSEHVRTYQKKARALIDNLRRKGVIVRIRKNMHEKVILIDDTLVWQGSLNLLSYKSTTEQMQRIASKKMQKRVTELLDLDDYAKIKETNDPAMRCEFCKGLLVKKSGLYGDFYGCTSFPDCGFTKTL